MHVSKLNKQTRAGLSYLESGREKGFVAANVDGGAGSLCCLTGSSLLSSDLGLPGPSVGSDDGRAGFGALELRTTVRAGGMVGSEGAATVGGRGLGDCDEAGGAGGTTEGWD